MGPHEHYVRLQNDLQRLRLEKAMAGASVALGSSEAWRVVMGQYQKLLEATRDALEVASQDQIQGLQGSASLLRSLLSAANAAESHVERLDGRVAQIEAEIRELEAAGLKPRGEA